MLLLFYNDKIDHNIVILNKTVKSICILKKIKQNFTLMLYFFHGYNMLTVCIHYKHNKYEKYAYWIVKNIKFSCMVI